MGRKTRPTSAFRFAGAASAFDAGLVYKRENERSRLMRVARPPLLELTATRHGGASMEKIVLNLRRAARPSFAIESAVG